MFEMTDVYDFAEKAYADANCEYDGKSYMTHINMVADVFVKRSTIFNNVEDGIDTQAAIYCHDLIEDAKLSYNNIMEASSKSVADIVLAVTDVNESNRLLRHLATMPRTVKDHRAIILKMCDIYANASYSRDHKSSMYEKYIEEYYYRRPIFKKALNWYRDKLNMYNVEKFWLELDRVHWGDKVIVYNSRNLITL